jgi:uncharacterized protein
MKFLPQVFSIASFGDGGFRFGTHSHLGSLLILPSGMRAWEIGESLNLKDFISLIAEKTAIDFVLLGTGVEMIRPPREVLKFFAGENLSVDFMSTGSAVHAFNVMLAEGRRVAAALVAVP